MAASLLAGGVLLWGMSGTAKSQTDQPLARNVELVGHSDLGGRGLHAAVWGHRDFAYVGSAGQRSSNNPALCPGRGVTVVDIADPGRPEVVGSVAQRTATTAEDVHVLAVDSAEFRGDLLATGIQRCSEEGTGGLSLWDVTDPRAPVELGFFGTGRGPIGVHELDVFRRESRTIGLLAVPFSETLDPQNQGDLRIVDLSDPRAPVQLGHWGLGRGIGQGARDGLGRDSQNYAHSVRASLDGRLAYVSYWDAGAVILDISDLDNPRYVGRTQFAPGDEGNAHSAVPAKGGRLLVQADEDVYTRNEALYVQVGASSELVDASYGSFRTLAGSEGVFGPTVYVGRGCPESGGGLPEDPYFADPVGRVALVDRGDCTFVEKVQRAQQLGAIGVVIGNRGPGTIALDGDVSALRIPAAMIAQDSADRVKEALARGEAVAIGLSTEQGRYDDWGYLRFWDITDPTNPVQVAQFATEHARPDPRQGAPEGGWYTAHQPVVLGDRLYVSWYSDGVRILDIADPTRPREVGYFVPPRGEPRPGEPVAHTQRPFVWGIYVRGDLILASDQHTGLYILRERG